MAIYTNILTGGSNNHETTSENANALATDFVSEGVVGAITNTSGVAPMTGALAVNAQGTPDMTVAVSSGVAYVTATPSGQASQTLRIYNNASANVTIAANSSGSTKYDWVYLSVSAANAANPNTAGDNVTTLVTSRSSSASSDDGTPPTYGYPLAVVTVANGASSITNGNIADIREVTGATPRSENAAGYPIDWYQEIGRTTLGSAGSTITVSSLPARKYLKIVVFGIASGGNLATTLRFNNDSANNYSLRISDSGASHGTFPSQSGITLDPANNTNVYSVIDIVNLASQEKLVYFHTIMQGAAGAGNVTASREGFPKWSNTSAYITRIDVTTASNNFGTGSEVIVLGHD